MDQPGSTDPWAPSTGQYYSTDPADLFAQLYDAIPDSVFLGWDAMKWNDSAPVRRQALEISTAILESGEVDTAHVEELIEEHGPRGMFTVLLGLDWTLIYVNPYGPAFGDVNLTNLQLRYAERQLLNSTAVSGALLPRCTFPGRPRGKLDKAEFFGVHRIPAEQWAKVEHRSVPPELDRHFNRSRPVPVACAPVIETLDELKIEFAERHGAAVFTLRPVNSAKLRSRLDTLLYRLDTSGARIAVLPEGTLSDSLLRHWRTLIDSRTDDLGTPTGLDFLLVGSGPVGSGQAPTNRAVLLHRHSGTELLSQDKLNSFTLDPDQTKLWRLRPRHANRG
jgi:hypothetical protein